MSLYPEGYWNKALSNLHEGAHLRGPYEATLCKSKSKLLVKLDCSLSH